MDAGSPFRVYWDSGKGCAGLQRCCLLSYHRAMWLSTVDRSDLLFDVGIVRTPRTVTIQYTCSYDLSDIINFSTLSKVFIHVQKAKLPVLFTVDCEVK